MHEERLVQKQLAARLGVDQSTISRWLSFEGESDFPASLISALTLECEPLGVAMLKFNADKMGYDVVKRVRASELDGTLTDEVFDIMKHLGRVVEEFKTSGPGGYKKCRAQLDAIADAVAKAKEELNTMSASTHAHLSVLGSAKA